MRSATLPRLTQSRWLPGLVMAGALAWIVMSLVNSLWNWLTPPAEVLLSDVVSVALTSQSQGIPLAQFRLFGNAVDPAAAAYADAPDTALRLTLKGTSSHHEQGLARAVIADEQAEKVYKVGDEFPHGVRIQAIYPDRVVLNAAGKIEVLRLRQEGNSAGAAAGIARAAPLPSPVAPGANGLIGLNAPPVSAPGSVNPMAVVSAPVDWEAVRQQAIADPNSLAKAFSVLPVMVNGKLAGVRLSSNTYGVQLAQAGLLPDDIVTAVNGSVLNSIEAGYAALASLKTAGAVTLTVNRNGAEKTLPAIRMPR